MKVSSLNSVTNKHTLSTNLNVKINNNVTCPITFGSNHDFFEIEGLIKNTLEIDKKDIPNNTQMGGSKFFTYTQYTGPFANRPTSIKIFNKGTKSRGAYDGGEFILKAPNSKHPEFNLKGDLIYEPLEMNGVELNGKYFIEGSVGDRKIKLKSYTDLYHNNIAGFVGDDYVEMVINKSSREKEAIGKINDVPFRINIAPDEITGGCQENSRTLALLFVITACTPNEVGKYERLKEMESYDRWPKVEDAIDVYW